MAEINRIAGKYAFMDEEQLFIHFYNSLPKTSEKFHKFHAEIIAMANHCEPERHNPPGITQPRIPKGERFAL